MAANDKQLVEQVTRQVIAVLRQRGLAKSSSPVAVSPPAGLCTGGQGQVHVGEPVNQVVSEQVQPSVMPLTGIITANQLQKAMKLAADGVAVVSHSARLTPLAHDLVRQEPGRLRRLDVNQQVNASGVGRHGSVSASPEVGSWVWWADGGCDAVMQLISQRRSGLLPSSHRRDDASLTSVIRDVASSLGAGHIGGAILFVKHGARAMCFANRCNHIRAVLGSCSGAVEQGISELGANVLVIEYPYIGPVAMGGMVDQMLAKQPKASPMVLRALADLHRCQ